MYGSNIKKGYLNPTDWLNDKRIPGFYAEDIYNIFPEATQLNEAGEPEDWNFRVMIPANDESYSGSE